MATSTLFITGATGYIGGSVLSGIVRAHGTNLSVTALLRAPSKEFASHYPDVKVVEGSFDSFDVIEKAASEHEIIIRRL